MNASRTKDTRQPWPGPTIEEFESLNFDPESFDHTAHLYIAWSYLQRFDLLTSIGRYCSALRRLTEKLSLPEKYHETTTWFFLIALAERIATGRENSWTKFIEQNPDLLARNPSLIQQFYSDHRLASEHARREFVLPDRASVAD